MTLKLTLAKAVSMIERAIAAKGADYVYPGSVESECHYADRDYDTLGNEVFTKGCIVGHAFLTEFNIEPQDAFHSDWNEGTDAQALIQEFAEMGKIDPAVGRMAFKYLEYVQTSQDNGATWGEAHEKALQGQVWNRYKNEWIQRLDIPSEEL